MIGKIIGLLLFAASLILALQGRSEAKVDVDAYIDRNYNFAGIKSVYIRPSISESLPEMLRLSLPGKIDDWVESAMKSKNVTPPLFLKSTDSVWQSVRLLHGDGGFQKPFENEASARYFYSHLEGACTAVLAFTVSLETQRRWQEPSTETYTAIERVHSVERRKKSNGHYETVDVYTDVPVTKTRQVPGYWYIEAVSRCHMTFSDVQGPEEKRIAEVNAAARDTSREGDERKMLENLVRRTINESVGAVFYKSKR